MLSILYLHIGTFRVVPCSVRFKVYDASGGAPERRRRTRWREKDM